MLARVRKIHFVWVLSLALCATAAPLNAQAISKPLKAQQSSHCSLREGPRAGSIVEVRSLPIGSPCNDGLGSAGVIVPRSKNLHGTIHHAAHRAHAEHHYAAREAMRHVKMAAGTGGVAGGAAETMPAPPPPPPPEAPATPPAEAPAPPPAERPQAEVLAHVTDIMPYYWKPEQSEPKAVFYFYLLFGEGSTLNVQLAALRAVICDLRKSPIVLPPVIKEDEVPLLMPVVAGFNAKVGPLSTEAELLRFHDESYDDSRAQGIIQRLGLNPRNVYLVASRKPVGQLPSGAARSPGADYRAVYVDHTDPYEGIAMRSIISEAYDGTLFKGRSSRDVGYALVSFVYKLGTVMATVVPEANAATSTAAKEDQGICQADNG